MANQRGMRPLEVSAVVEAPLSTNSFTTFRNPALAAQCIGVQPSWEVQMSSNESLLASDHLHLGLVFFLNFISWQV